MHKVFPGTPLLWNADQPACCVGLRRWSVKDARVPYRIMLAGLGLGFGGAWCRLSRCGWSRPTVRITEGYLPGPLFFIWLGASLQSLASWRRTLIHCAGAGFGPGRG